MALAAYRALLRSAKLAFAGDARTLAAALEESRRGFETNRGAPAGAAAGLVQDAHEVAQVLRRNVVQGRLAGEDQLTYRPSFSPPSPYLDGAADTVRDCVTWQSCGYMTISSAGITRALSLRLAVAQLHWALGLAVSRCRRHREWRR